MANEDQKAIVRRLIEEVWNQGNLAVADELLAPDLAARHTGWVERFRTALPDLRCTIDLLVAEDDWVVALQTRTGSHTGVATGLFVGQLVPGGELAPTGRRVSTTGALFCRIEDGRIVELRVLGDTLKLFQQLGVLAGGPGA